MTTSNNVAELAIWRGNGKTEITRLRRNEKTGLLEYKHSGFFEKWYPIHRKIPLHMIEAESILYENGIPTKIRAVIINQSISGEECTLRINPRTQAMQENLQTEVTRLKRLCRNYYDVLYNMVGEDQLKELMKQKFKAVKEIKAEGSTGMDYDPYNRFSGYSRPLGLVGRPPI